LPAGTTGGGTGEGFGVGVGVGFGVGLDEGLGVGVGLEPVVLGVGVFGTEGALLSGRDKATAGVLAPIIRAYKEYAAKVKNKNVDKNIFFIIIF
jgi:hypothetical protein